MLGSIPPNEVENFMQKTISTMKRTPFIDPQTGEYNLKYNLQNSLEDFYIPVRGNDTTTKIEPQDLTAFKKHGLNKVDRVMKKRYDELVKEVD